MKKIFLVIVLMVLSACSNHASKQAGEVKAEDHIIPLIEVKQAIMDKGITLSKGEMLTQFKLMNVNQSAFHSNNNEQIYIYEFSSAEDRVNGYKKIEEQTQLIDFAHFPIYLEHRNVLVIYLNYPPKGKGVENKLREGIKSL